MPSVPPQGWRQHVPTIALLAAVALVLALAWHVLDQLSAGAANADAVDSVLASQRRVIGFAAVLVLAIALALAALLWRLGQATYAQERFPPAGLPKLLDAEPRKGVAAAYLGLRLRRAAVLAALVGVAIALSAAWFALHL